MAENQRAGRFTDVAKGEGVVAGYRDATADKPFDKKFLKRNFAEYDVLKKGGLHKNLGKLKNMSDVQIESLAAKAVLKDSGYTPKKLTTKYNRAKHNVKWAKKVMARRQAGQTIKKQTLKRTKAARSHVAWVNRNRRAMKAGPVYQHIPEGF